MRIYMIFDDFFDKYFNYFKNILLSINNYKIGIYSIFLFIYFLLYYLITIPQSFKDSDNNILFNFFEKINKKKLFNLIFIIIDVIFIISFILINIFYFKNINNNKLKIYILISIFIVSIMLYINIILYSKYLISISNSNITKYIFLIVSYFFYFIFFILFIYNINVNIIENIEFFISFEVLILFLIEYIITFYADIKKLYYNLKNDDFSTLTINCLNNDINENYDNVKNQNIQIKNIEEKYGDNYIKTNGNIPISFYNKNIEEYQDLFLCDFYYPGSYYSYLADSPLNGTPTIEALKIVLSVYKARIIHLDVISDKKDPYDPLSNPVICCENLRKGKKPLNFDEVMGTINKFAWNTDKNNLSYPLFLYLNFNFSDENENIYVRIYESLLKFFSKYFIDKKYSFSGRNNNFPISTAKIKDCLGKIIIITNRYPTKTVLDELINTTSNDLNDTFNIQEYKQSYITYDKLGLSQDNDKNELLLKTKSSLNFYYTNPNINYKNNSQEKSGLFNPSFQDCAQYGINATLMYVFLPDENFKKWNLFFKNKNNLDPVLKDESLRLVNNNTYKINKQNPILGLQKPQKYCLIPGSLSTEKSNLSDNYVNSTCN